MAAQVPGAPLRFVAYVGRQRFMMLASSFLLDRAKSPYRRLATTLLLGCRAPFTLEVGDGPPLTLRAALIAPRVPRRRLSAVGSDLVAIDFPLRSPEYFTLEPVFEGRQVVPLDIGRFESLQSMFDRAFTGTLLEDEVKQLFRDTVQAAVGRMPQERMLDPRIEKAIGLINDLPFAQATLGNLARQLHLSPSRLGHLFKDETGSNISQYARWVAVWRAISLWTRGKPLTEIAHEVGFHDLSHLDHAFIEVFGLNPSTVIDPRTVALIQYE